MSDYEQCDDYDDCGDNSDEEGCGMLWCEIWFNDPALTYKLFVIKTQHLSSIYGLQGYGGIVVIAC